MENQKAKINLKQWILEKNVRMIRAYAEETSVNDILLELHQLDELEVVLFFRFLKTDEAGYLFSSLPEEMQQSIVQNLTKKEITDIIDELYTDEIADLLEALPPDLAKTILLSVDKATRIKVNSILQFSEDEVGSIMSVDLIMLKDHLTNQEALQFIKTKREEAEIGQYYYVVDQKNKLLGATTLEEIVFAPKDALISEQMEKVIPIYTKQLKEEAAHIFAAENYSTLPVITQDGTLIGMLTSDDVIDIITEEASEDIYKASGISTNQPHVSYIKASIFSLVKSRVFWLIILMIGSTLSQVIIQFLSVDFDDKLVSIGVSSSLMIALIPVTSATSGNAGSQSTSTLTRAVSLNEINQDKMSTIFFKEMSVGLLLGTILAIVNYLRLCIYYMATRDLFGSEQTRNFILLISLVSSISLFLSITFSKMLGTSILIIGLKAKKDPAVMAAPLLTTLIDGLATLIFFALAYAVIMPVFFSGKSPHALNYQTVEQLNVFLKTKFAS